MTVVSRWLRKCSLAGRQPCDGVQSVNILHCLHWHILYYTKLHCTALHCTALHFTVLHCTQGNITALATVGYLNTAFGAVWVSVLLHPMHYTDMDLLKVWVMGPLGYTTLHCILLHCIMLHCMAFHCTAPQYTALHFIIFHYNAMHYTSLHCISLHWNVHCTALHRISLHYNTLHCTVAHCITLCRTALWQANLNTCLKI